MRRATICILALLFAFTALGDDVIKRGFTVADGGTLRLHGAYGNIRVVTGGSGVAVEITRDADGRDGERMLQNHKIDFEQRGNDVVIKSDLDEHRGWFRWFDGDDYEVQWNIRVPDRYNVELDTSGGWIEVDDIDGTVDARTSGGNIRTGTTGANSTLKTSGGDIRVAGAAGRLEAYTSGGSIDVGDSTGPVEVKTSGGSITLGRVESSVVARTSGGGIRIEEVSGSVDAVTSGGSIVARISRQPQGDSKLATSGGSVTVTLSPTVAVNLDARASGGGVDTDVPVTISGTQSDDVVRGVINGGGPRLVLRTSGGGIRVRKL